MNSFVYFLFVCLVIAVYLYIRENYIIYMYIKVLSEYQDFFSKQFEMGHYEAASKFYGMFNNYHVNFDEVMFGKPWIWRKKDMLVGDYKEDFYNHLKSLTNCPGNV